MTTKAEAKQQAAELLSLVAVGQGVPAEYDSVLDDAWDEVNAMEQVNEIATWDSAGPIPDEVTLYFVGLMAKQKMSIVKTSQATKNEILSITGLFGELAEWGIRRMIVEDYEDLEESTSYL